MTPLMAVLASVAFALGVCGAAWFALSIVDSIRERIDA